MKSEPSGIAALAEAAAARFHREQAQQFGECAVNLMATSMPIRDVILWLERQADMLREFG